MEKTLTIRVTYDDVLKPKGRATEQALEHAARHLASNGLLSGDDPSLIVDEWVATVS